MSLFNAGSIVAILGDLVVGVLLYILAMEMIKDDEYLLLRKKVFALRTNW